MISDEENRDARYWASIGALVAVVILLLIASSCAHRTEVRAPTDVDRGVYAYREIEPNTFIVWVKSGPDSQAKEELCTKSYVCSVGEGGHIIVIERKRK